MAFSRSALPRSALPRSALPRSLQFIDCPAGFAGPQVLVAFEFLDDRFQLLAQIDEVKFGIVNQGAAFLAIPAHMVVGLFQALVLDDQADGSGGLAAPSL